LSIVTAAAFTTPVAPQSNEVEFDRRWAAWKERGFAYGLLSS
jgi:hypothetical protein